MRVHTKSPRGWTKREVKLAIIDLADLVSDITVQYPDWKDDSILRRIVEVAELERENLVKELELFRNPQ